MKTHDFWYDLPEELIAQTPLERRDGSRLMVLNRETGEIQHKHFYDVIDYLNPGDCLVMNDSRVLPARLHGPPVPTGGVVEVLLLRGLGQQVLGVPGASPVGKLQVGNEVILRRRRADGRCSGSAGGRQPGGANSGTKEFFWKCWNALGKMPLPPYIKEELQDQERYQTVYSREVGSAAAPTAGLHFTKELLEKIREKGVNEAFVTLHVGLGTFRPVKAEEVTEHRYALRTVHDERRNRKNH